jgi:hypothetical protein
MEVSDRVFLLVQKYDVDYIKASFPGAFERLNFLAVNVISAEYAFKLGATRVSLLNDFLIDPYTLYSISVDADRAARVFDNHCANLRKNIFGLHADSLGWEYFFWNRIAWPLLIWKRAAPSLAQALMDGRYYCVVNFQNNIDFYFDSRYQRQFLIDECGLRGVNIASLSFGTAPNFKEDAYDSELDVPDLHSEVLCHMPTVFRDLEAHKTRLLGKGDKDVIDLQSPYFDQIVTDRRIKLLPVSKCTGESSEFDTYRKGIELAVREFLIFLGINDGPRQNSQVERMQRRAVFQMKAFRKLAQAENLRRIRKVEVCCHDGGLLGPVLTWANQIKAEVEVWPHSGVVNIPLPPIDRGSVHSSARINKDFLNLGIPSHRWVDQWSHASNWTVRRKHIIILFSELEIFGVPFCSAKDVKRTIADFVFRLREIGWSCVFRQRPTMLYPTVLRFENAPEASGPLLEWVKWADVCVSIVQPTSALLEFWRAGVRCFHAQESRLCEDEKFILPEQQITCYDQSPLSESMEKIFKALE